jgi:hypothetical protein
MNRTMKVALLLAVCAIPAAELTAQADGQRAARQSWTSDRGRTTSAT